ncbi:hypothetical protein TUMEXPCC7403_12990 [Tumidithrix helvetica PCC 7403]
MIVLKTLEILKLLDEYIGGFGSFSVGNFNDKTLAEFYPEYCGFELDPHVFQYIGRNVHEKFIAIFFSVPPDQQADIIRGVLKKFPLNAPSYCPKSRTQDLYAELLGVAEYLECLSLQLA